MHRDVVDTIMEQWSGARPEADISPLAVLSRIMRLGKRLNLARASAFAHAGLEPWEFDVLSALRRAGQPLTPTRPIEETMVTSGTMTNRLSGLSERGLITRVAHQTDRRSMLVEVTDKGIDRVDTALDTLLSAEQRILARLDDDERETLATLLRKLSAGV